MTYDEDLRTVSFSGINSDKAGNYALTVQLTDSEGASTSYNITFEITQIDELDQSFSGVSFDP
jgi:hypothetical protein